MTLVGVSIEALAGVLIGGAITYFFHWQGERRRRAGERNVAAMQIATGLRAWLTACVELVEEINLYQSTNGHAGVLRTDVPDFAFEATLEIMSLLPPDQATKIFTLIHDKEAARGGVTFALERADMDQAIETLCKGLGKLYLDALPIYEALVERAGWPGMSLPAGDLGLMRLQIRRGEQIAREDANLVEKTGQTSEGG